VSLLFYAKYILFFFVILPRTNLLCQNAKCLYHLWPGAVFSVSASRSENSPCGICRGTNGTGTGFPRDTSAFPWQYRATTTPYLT